MVLDSFGEFWNFYQTLLTRWLRSQFPKIIFLGFLKWVILRLSIWINGVILLQSPMFSIPICRKFYVEPENGIKMQDLVKGFEDMNRPSESTLSERKFSFSAVNVLVSPDEKFWKSFLGSFPTLNMIWSGSGQFLAILKFSPDSVNTLTADPISKNHFFALFKISKSSTFKLS